MELSSKLAILNRTCDYIPFISTTTNFVGLFEKILFKILPAHLTKIINTAYILKIKI